MKRSEAITIIHNILLQHPNSNACDLEILTEDILSKLEDIGILPPEYIQKSWFKGYIKKVSNSWEKE